MMDINEIFFFFLQLVLNAITYTPEMFSPHYREVEVDREAA